MEEFKLKALQTATQPTKFWCRYVNDTCTINTKFHVQALFTHLNSQHQSITCTIEEDGTLPMLEVLMEKENNKGKDRGLQKEDTHTDPY